ncbi:MAG: 30S ribosomal protein S3 [Candidatus Nanoarchaeia archaeon]|nr:30S ribosomal protein S3 [Candidatus Nanoarchaeia archaeon]
MIERKFIQQKMKEFHIQEYVSQLLKGTGYSHTEIQRTPLGEKVIIYTTRPGIVVGRKGESINKLTSVLKTKFNMENPQIEIGEVANPMLDVHYIADKIASTLERFGSKRFKSIGYKTLQNILDAGALGAEIVISGKVPSARAKRWRFKAGYLKKSGDISENHVLKGYTTAQLNSGIVGIKVSIMPSTIKLFDKINVKSAEEVIKKVETEVPTKEEKPKKETKKTVKKPAVKKTTKKTAINENKEEIKTLPAEPKTEEKVETKENIDGNNKEK